MTWHENLLNGSTHRLRNDLHSWSAPPSSFNDQTHIHVPDASYRPPFCADLGMDRILHSFVSSPTADMRCDPSQFVCRAMLYSRLRPLPKVVMPLLARSQTFQPATLAQFSQQNSNGARLHIHRGHRLPLRKNNPVYSHVFRTFNVTTRLESYTTWEAAA